MKIILNELLGKRGGFSIEWGTLKAGHLKFTEPEKTYLNKKVCVTGKLVLYNDKPQIVVNETKQIHFAN